MNAPGKQKLMSFPGMPLWYASRAASYAGRYWVLTVLASLLVVSDGVLLSALVFVAMTGPSFIGSPIGGWWSDVKPPAEVMRVVASSRAVLFMLIALVVTLNLPSVFVILATALYGLAHAASSSASSLVLHSLVPDSVFPRALSSIELTTSAGIALGSLAAAFIMPGSIIVAVAVAVCAELLVITAVRNIPTPENHNSVSSKADPAKSFPNPFQGIPEGIRVIRASSILKLAFFLFAVRLALPVVPLTAARVVTLEPVSWLSSEVASMTGFFKTVATASSVLAALVLGKFITSKNAELFLLSAVASASLAFVVWSWSASFYIVLLVGIAHQVSSLVVDVTTKLIVHTRVDIKVRGRVLGLLRTVVGASSLTSLSLIGYLVGLYGFNVTIVVGIAAFVTTSLSYTTMRNLIRENPAP